MRVFFFSLLLFCLTAAASGAQTVASQTGSGTGLPAAAPAEGADDEEGNNYRIGYQDTIEIQVFRHPDLIQKVTVGPAGTIVLFGVDHPVIAVCKTERELAKDIADAYNEKYLRNARVAVAVSEQKSRSIAVIGAVEKPGNYFIAKRVHLLEMLAYAGGPNKEAGTRILVARAGSNTVCKQKDEPEDENVDVLDFKLRDVQEGKQTLWMEPGDVVSVLDADIVYVYGNVIKHGALKLREPITLTQAIASAEGLKPAAKTDKVRILRQMPGQADRQELVFDLGQIDKGKVKDPFLQPNDIVAVSEDKVKSIMQGFKKVITNSLPNAAYRIP
jgi:polysaccharide export outer membrane protein